MKRMNGKQRGLTLLELMIALALTSIVGYMAFRLFRDEHANYTVTRDKVSLQSDAREAVRLMEEEIKNLGFATTIVLPSVSQFNTAFCNDVNFTGTNSAFDTPSAARLKFRFYNPFATFSCGAGRFTYAYRLNGTVLERAAWQGADVTDANATWVPFLRGVQRFVVRYGVAAPKTELFDVSHFTHTTPSSLFNLTGGVTIAVDQSNASDRPWLVSGWAITEGRALFNNRAYNLVAGARYRLSFRAHASESFRATDVVGATRWILRSTTGTTDAVAITFDPGPPGATRPIQFEFTVPATGDYNIGLVSQMSSAPTSAPNCWVGITNLKLTLLSHPGYNSWLDEASASPDWAAVGAVRIELDVENSKEDHVVVDRIIPVVNNALN